MTRIKTYVCEHCSVDFATNSKKPAKYCSDQCWNQAKIERKFANGRPGYDYVVCPVCNRKARQISYKHAKMHGFDSASQLAKQFDVAITCEKQIENGSGQNNPAAGHGGKYSKWSKNFIHGYDAQAHAQFVQGQSQRRNDPTQKHLYKSNIEYWMQQCNGDIEQAQQAYTKFQTRDLNFFVEKYGEAEGQRRHSAKIEKWLRALDSKTPEEKLEINRKKLWKNGRISKSENLLFTMLLEHLDELKSQFYLKKNQSQWYIYDIVFGKKIIEFNGDYWHANPEKYKESDKFRRGRSEVLARDIWELDRQKINAAKAQDYQVYVVWESEFKKNKKEVVDQCLNFLTA